MRKPVSDGKKIFESKEAAAARAAFERLEAEAAQEKVSVEVKGEGNEGEENARNSKRQLRQQRAAVRLKTKEAPSAEEISSAAPPTNIELPKTFNEQPLLSVAAAQLRPNREETRLESQRERAVNEKATEKVAHNVVPVTEEDKKALREKLYVLRDSVLEELRKQGIVDKIVHKVSSAPPQVQTAFGEEIFDQLGYERLHAENRISGRTGHHINQKTRGAIAEYRGDINTLLRQKLSEFGLQGELEIPVVENVLPLREVLTVLEAKQGVESEALKGTRSNGSTPGHATSEIPAAEVTKEAPVEGAKDTTEETAQSTHLQEAKRLCISSGDFEKTLRKSVSDMAYGHLRTIYRGYEREEIQDIEKCFENETQYYLSTLVGRSKVLPPTSENSLTQYGEEGIFLRNDLREIIRAGIDKAVEDYAAQTKGSRGR